MAEATSLEALASGLKRQAHSLGFDPVGIAAVTAGERMRLRSAALERWLQAGHQADMGWMADPRRRGNQGPWRWPAMAGDATTTA
jgi:epoxyqueuosine reductase